MPRLLTALLIMLLPVAHAYAEKAPVSVGVTTITLSVSEQKQVKQDTLIANVRYEVRGKTAEEVQKKINEKMSKAIALIKKEPSVKVSTEAYSVYMNQQIETQTDPKTGAVKNIAKTEWFGSQGVTLESKNAQKVQELTGQLQGMGLAISNLAYSLSPAQAEAVHDSLMTAAVGKLKKQAEMAASLLGKKRYNIAEIAVDGNGMPQPVMPMAMMARADMAMEKAMPAPTAEAGESTISMTLTAKVELKD